MKRIQSSYLFVALGLIGSGAFAQASTGGIAAAPNAQAQSNEADLALLEGRKIPESIISMVNEHSDAASELFQERVQRRSILAGSGVATAGGAFLVSKSAKKKSAPAIIGASMVVAGVPTAATALVIENQTTDEVEIYELGREVAPFEGPAKSLFKNALRKNSYFEYQPELVLGMMRTIAGKLSYSFDEEDSSEQRRLKFVRIIKKACLDLELWAGSIRQKELFKSRRETVESTRRLKVEEVMASLPDLDVDGCVSETIMALSQSEDFVDEDRLEASQGALHQASN